MNQKMNVKIRTAVAADIPALCSIFKNDLGYAGCSRKIVETQFAGLDSNREAVFVAVADMPDGAPDCSECGAVSDLSGGIVAGVIHVEKYNVLYFPVMANILGLAVDSRYRRKGIGRALLNRAEQWAKENGITQMRLNSGSSRIQAHEFYRAQGYSGDKTQLRFLKDI